METWTRKKIAKRFEECELVFKRLPNEHRLGFKSFWPEIKLTPDEIALQEKKTRLQLRPMPDQIDRALETQRWVEWVNEGERNLIWLKAKGLRWIEISRRTGFPERSGRRYWSIALDKIVNRLNTQESV